MYSSQHIAWHLIKWQSVSLCAVRVRTISEMTYARVETQDCLTLSRWEGWDCWLLRHRGENDTKPLGKKSKVPKPSAGLQWVRAMGIWLYTQAKPRRRKLWSGPWEESLGYKPTGPSLPHPLPEYSVSNIPGTFLGLGQTWTASYPGIVFLERQIWKLRSSSHCVRPSHLLALL